MELTAFIRELNTELDESHDRLTAYSRVMRYSGVPVRRLQPIFEEVSMVNFQMPSTAWETAQVILYSTWFNLLRRRNKLHNAAMDLGSGSEEVLQRFREDIANEEQSIFQRLERTLNS